MSAPMQTWTISSDRAITTTVFAVQDDVESKVPAGIIVSLEADGVSIDQHLSIREARELAAHLSAAAAFADQAVGQAVHT